MFKSDIKMTLFIQYKGVNHIIVPHQGSCMLKKINSSDGLEKLHTKVTVQFSLIVFHQATVMKGNMIINQVIASNH